MCSEHVEKLADKYDLKVKVFTNTVFITSEYDEWVAEVDHKQRIKLKHTNKGRRKRSGKFRTHSQDKFTDIKNVFECIKSHDKMKCRKVIDLPIV